MADKKYKIIISSDMVLSYSGVANQTRYIIDHLVKTGKFKIIHLGAAMRHENKNPGITKEWGEDCVIVPTESYAPPNVIRQLIDLEKPDAVWLMTDPRFYVDFFRMEQEVHQQCPILWNTIWDNFPAPKYNRHFYEATDFLGCINKLTFEIMKELGFENKAKYIPHGAPETDFFIMPDDEIMKSKISFLGPERKNAFVVFYNSRNALRKRTGNVIWAFKEFSKNLKPNEAVLIMNTPPGDPEGQDLNVVLDHFDLRDRIVLTEKNPIDRLREFYNISNVTVSMSSEEGFGLSVLESLMCGTPVACTKTGGMQDQVIDPDLGKTFGFCLESDADSLVGGQTTPYIWSQTIDPKTMTKALTSLYDTWKTDPKNYKDKIAGIEARESMLRRFNLKNITKQWEEEIIRTIEEYKQKKENKKLISISI